MKTRRKPDPDKIVIKESDFLTPTPKNSWRLIVDFPDTLADEIQSEADRIGINYQATVKTLVDEALRLRRQQTVTMDAVPAKATTVASKRRPRRHQRTTSQ